MARLGKKEVAGRRAVQAAPRRVSPFQAQTAGRCFCALFLRLAARRPAFPLGELSEDPLAMYLEDLYTLSANLAGLPAISVPAGFSRSGLPIGMQLLGPPLQEQRLLRAARMFERETDWHTRRPLPGTAARARPASKMTRQPEPDAPAR